MKSCASLVLCCGLLLATAPGLSAPAAAEGSQPQRVPPAQFGEPFPAAVFPNLNPEAGGPQIDLSAITGKHPVVLCYWIAGHARSEKMLLDLQEIAREHGADKLTLLGVATERPGRDAASITERAKALGVRIPVINDQGFRIGQQLLVQTVPSVALLDAGGRLRLANGASLRQTVEYNLNLEQVVRRAASTGSVGSYGYLAKYYPVKELVGRKCPDFKATDLASGVTRRWHNLLDPGKVNVLMFWSVDCPHCKKTVPELSRWFREHADGINLVSAARINDEAMKNKTKEFCKLHGISFPTLSDDNRAVSEVFQVTATPTLLVVAPDGTIDSALVSGGDFKAALEAKKRELLKSGT